MKLSTGAKNHSRSSRVAKSLSKGELHCSGVSGIATRRLPTVPEHQETLRDASLDADLSQEDGARQQDRDIALPRDRQRDRRRAEQLTRELFPDEPGMLERETNRPGHGRLGTAPAFRCVQG
jgi:hypothetical protein